MFIVPSKRLNFFSSSMANGISKDLSFVLARKIVLLGKTCLVALFTIQRKIFFISSPMFTLYELKSPKMKETTQYYAKQFFLYRLLLDFLRPSKILCLISGRQNHWSLLDTYWVPWMRIRSRSDRYHFGGSGSDLFDINKSFFFCKFAPSS